MKITENMVNDFNKTLETLKCSFRLKFNEEERNPTCNIVPSNDLFIDSSIINLNNKFYEMLENYFLERGIELTYNNTGSTFWSKAGWQN